MTTASTLGAQGMSRSEVAPSFAEMAERHLDTVHRYLAHLTRDAHLAEDLTGETFELALRRYHRYDPERGSPATWLCAIAHRVALDHFRSDARRRRRERRYAEEEPTQVAPEPLGGLSPALEAALGRLSRAEREVIALRVVLELSGAEAARVLGVSPTACSSLLHRALTKLRGEVSDDDRA